jgi:hypothetical protein
MAIVGLGVHDLIVQAAGVLLTFGIHMWTERLARRPAELHVELAAARLEISRQQLRIAELETLLLRSASASNHDNHTPE